MKRKKITLGLMLCLSLILGTSNSFAASETSQFENGKFSVTGNVKKVSNAQMQGISGVKINVRIPYELENIEYYVVQGSKKEDNTYTYDYRMTTDNERVISTPVEYNEKEHTLLIKVGTASGAVAPDPNANQGTFANSPAPSPSDKGVKGAAANTTAPNPVLQSDHSAVSNSSVLEENILPVTQPEKSLVEDAAPLAATSTETGSFRTIWEDPVKWNVNWVRDNIEFSYDGSTVSWISGDDERWWLSASGWWEETHSITSYYSSGNTKVTVSTDAHFMNDTFCVGGTTTHTYYTGNKISGNANGSINGDVTTSASGGCSSMLHYYSELSH